MNDYEKKVQLGQLKICVEKHLDKHSNTLKNLKDVSKNETHFNKLRAAFLKQFYWNKNDVINIGFMDNAKLIPRNTYNDLISQSDSEGKSLKIDPLQKEVDKMDIITGIKTIVQKRIQPIVGLKFNFIDDYKNANIRISFIPTDGAWSVIGTQCNDPDIKDQATMNLGWFDVATTIHEFGHVLGMIHEHQNSIDNPILWNKENVYNWARNTQGWDKQTTDTNILSTYDISQINGSKFDPFSIMLYFFPAYLTTNDNGTRQNLKLSGYDVEYISKTYPGGSQTPEDFYSYVYNENLKDNILKSDNKRGKPYQKKQSKFLYYFIILTIISIIGLILYLFINH